MFCGTLKLSLFNPKRYLTNFVEESSITFNERQGQRTRDHTTKARFRRRSTHVPNLNDELSTAKERRLNQFGTAVLVWCGKSVKFDRVCRTFVELNLGSTHGTPSESDVVPVSLQSRTYSVRFDT